MGNDNVRGGEAEVVGSGGVVGESPGEGANVWNEKSRKGGSWNDDDWTGGNAYKGETGGAVVGDAMI